VNELTDLQQFDPISGFPVYKCLLCNVEKVLEETDRLVINRFRPARRLPMQDSLTSSRPNRLPRSQCHDPLAPELVEAMNEAVASFGNPFEHPPGRQALAQA